MLLIKWFTLTDRRAYQHDISVTYRQAGYILQILYNHCITIMQLLYNYCTTIVQLLFYNY